MKVTYELKHLHSTHAQLSMLKLQSANDLLIREVVLASPECLRIIEERRFQGPITG